MQAIAEVSRRAEAEDGGGAQSQKAQLDLQWYRKLLRAVGLQRQLTTMFPKRYLSVLSHRAESATAVRIRCCHVVAEVLRAVNILIPVSAVVRSLLARCVSELWSLPSFGELG